MADRIQALNSATRWTIFIAVAMVALAITVALKPIPQPLSYHRFADTRALFGIANAGDVFSNLAFLLAGGLGLYFALRKNSALTQDQKWTYATMFAGLVLTCFGSAYYHLAPDNSRLVWDRLPMTIAMAGLIGALLVDRFWAKC